MTFFRKTVLRSIVLAYFVAWSQLFGLASECCCDTDSNNCHTQIEASAQDRCQQTSPEPIKENSCCDNSANTGVSEPACEVAAVEIQKCVADCQQLQNRHSHLKTENRNDNGQVFYSNVVLIIVDHLIFQPRYSGIHYIHPPVNPPPLYLQHCVWII